MALDNKQKEVIELYQDFSSSFNNRLLYLLLEDSDEDNIFVSPTRLQALLVMIANWASPDISKHIIENIGSDIMSIPEANILCGKDMILPMPHKDWAIDENELPKIELQTLLWLQHRLKYNSDAVENLAITYPITVKNVDFTKNEAKQQIDKTIGVATHGLIKELQTVIEPDTLAFITDILYFKASWRYPFEEENTKEQLFYGTKGKKKVKMMKQTDIFPYQETSVCQIIHLPYQCWSRNQKSYSMRIFLPKSGHTCQEVLDEQKYNEFYLSTEQVEVNLSLPRFIVKSNIDMQDVLEKLDLGVIFESKDIIPECVKDLQITKIAQQTKVEVNESGTEATAVTYARMCGGCCPDFEKPKPIVMKVTRPFIFEIAEDNTNTIMFSGIINNIE